MKVRARQSTAVLHSSNFYQVRQLDDSVILRGNVLYSSHSTFRQYYNPTVTRVRTSSVSSKKHLRYKYNTKSKHPPKERKLIFGSRSNGRDRCSETNHILHCVSDTLSLNDTLSVKRIEISAEIRLCIVRLQFDGTMRFACIKFSDSKLLKRPNRIFINAESGIKIACCAHKLNYENT